MRSVVVAAMILAVACSRAQQVPKSASASSQSQNEMRTIDNISPQPVVLEPPPVLPDEAPAPKPRDAVQAENMIPLTEQDEQVRAKLPFAPAIGLDPVDGSKISIRATTPTFEMKNRVFYFSSEENKRTFAANPAQFMKGVFR